MITKRLTAVAVAVMLTLTSGAPAFAADFPHMDLSPAPYGAVSDEGELYVTESGGKRYLCGVFPGMTVPELLSRLNGDCRLYTTGGAEVCEGLVGSGFTVRYYVGTVLTDELTVCVDGDVTGDGLVNGRDLVRMKKYIAGEVQLDTFIADRSGDGAVNAEDVTSTVREITAEATELVISSPPTQTAYPASAVLNTDGMTVSLRYSDGELRTVYPGEYTVVYGDGEAFAQGDTYCTVVCGAFSAAVPVTVGTVDYALAPGEIPNILEYTRYPSSNSYQITTASGMRMLSYLSKSTNFSSKTIYLTCDIDMSGFEFTPIGRFAGTFDGGYHSLIDININTVNQLSGIFTRTTKTAVIRNLYVKGGTINARCNTDGHRAGSIVGAAYGSLIEGCFSSATVTAKRTTEASTRDISVGGIAGGTLDGAIVRNCCFAGEVNGEAHASGITDWGQGHNTGYVGTVVSCLVTGTLNADSVYAIGRYSASILEANKAGAVSNCYYSSEIDTNTYSWMTSAAAVTMSDIASGRVAYLLDGGEAQTRTRQWRQGDFMPLPDPAGCYKLTLSINTSTSASTRTVYVNAADSYKVSVPGATVTGGVDSMPAYDTTASMSINIPDILNYDLYPAAPSYVAVSADGLRTLSRIVDAGTDTFEGQSIYMLCDIDMQGVAFEPIGYYKYDEGDRTTSFRGTFCGNLFRILNLNVDKPNDDGAGLFGAAFDATIDSLGVYGSVTGANRVGGIAGYADKCRFTRCWNAAFVSSLVGSNGSGGIAGNARTSASFINCFNIGTVTSVANGIGGINGWGSSNVTVTGCYNVGRLLNNEGQSPLSRTSATYSRVMRGSYYLGAAAANGGEPLTRAQMMSPCFGYMLNTLAQSAANSSVYKNTPTYPFFARSSAEAASLTEVTVYSPYDTVLDTVFVFSNRDAVVSSCADGYFLPAGAALSGGEAAEVTVYAYKNTVTYDTSTFDAEATGDLSAYAEYYSDTGLALPQNIVNGSKRFVGWYEDSAFSGAVTYRIPAGEVGNKKYYAKWADDYAVSTPQQLAALASLVAAGDTFGDKYVYLTAPINMTGVEMLPIGSAAAPFCGVFDGCGYAISGLTVASRSAAGLFGYIKGAVVKNLVLDTSSITGGCLTGAIVGVNDGGAVVNCAADATVSTYGEEVDLSVMTFNVRVMGGDTTPNTISERLSRIESQIMSRSPDIIGMQEVVPEMKTGLDGFMTNYSSEFQYRGASSLEATPIYWKTSRFTCLEQGTFWLSTTPQTESVGWDSTYLRICSWAALLDNLSDELILFFNSHYEVSGKQARYEGAKLVAKRMQEAEDKYANLGYEHIILFNTADFNCSFTGNAYKAIDASYVDVRTAAVNMLSAADAITYNGYGKGSTLIDFIFVSDNVRVDSYEVMDELVGGYYSSDHFPVLAKLTVGGAYAGGIAGDNRGQIISCSHSGTVTSGAFAAGCAGRNSGYIAAFRTTAETNAAHGAQAVAAENTGTVQHCYYTADVPDQTGGASRRSALYINSRALSDILEKKGF